MTHYLEKAPVRSLGRPAGELLTHLEAIVAVDTYARRRRPWGGESTQWSASLR